MYKVVRANPASIQKLLDSSPEGSQRFRYFNKRNLSVVHDHLVSIIISEDEKPVAYGHIEEEAGRHWLGIMVADQAHGKGIGHVMMQILINSAFSMNVVEIHLSVDIINEKAIKLYEKNGFSIVNTEKHYHLMRLKNPKEISWQTH